MPKTLEYKIKFYSFWHVGAGLTGTTYADDLVNKNEDGLPMIPGKTLKGIIRDAASHLESLQPFPNHFLKSAFGLIPKEKRVNGDIVFSETDDEDSNGAHTFFSSAYISEALADALLSAKAETGLYQLKASTKINKVGVAEDFSLRKMEMTIPLELHATIEYFGDSKQWDSFCENMEKTMGFIKKMGANRHRGLGRCEFIITSKSE